MVDGSKSHQGIGFTSQMENWLVKKRYFKMQTKLRKNKMFIWIDTKN